MANPYERQPASAFWRTGVVEPQPIEITDVYRPRFAITRGTRIATQGSCFAQEIGRQFVRRGYDWFEAEPPLFKLPTAVNSAYNYGVFSYRTGNIYTPRLLLQWLRWASGEAEAPRFGWQSEAGVLDPFRPAIEPNGFESEAAMLASRERLLERMGETLGTLDVFVFTFGLTEGWEDRESGVVYPMCPGTLGGTFDERQTRFVNYSFLDCHRDMREAIALLRRHNAKMKVLLTVSPVPLVATATRDHVLVANSRSKSLLRTLAATLAEEDAAVDYFPSYELVTSSPFRSQFFEPNLRSIKRLGVEFIMREFFRAHGEEDGPASESLRRLCGNGQRGGRPLPRNASGGSGEATAGAAAPSEEDLVCEEIMLDAAAPSGR